MNLKIVTVLMICFVIGTASLYFVNDWYRGQYDVEKFQELWYSKSFSEDRDRILLMGSSHVVRLMPSHIQEFLSNEGYDYDVYNLGFPGDSHSSKKEYIEEIISINPKIIVFGMGYRDFQSKFCSVNPPSEIKSLSQPLDLFVDAQVFFQNFFKVENNDVIDIKNFENPKFTSLQIFQLLQGKSIIKTPDLNSTRPFKFTSDNLQMKPASFQELQNYVKKHPFENCVDPNNQNIVALKEIIKILQDNNIKVILFTTPHHKLFLDDLSNSNKDSFLSILDSISKETQVEVNFLHENYSDMEIWSDPSHITINSDSLIYSEDVAKIILRVVNK